MTFEPEWFLDIIVKVTSNQESTTSSLKEFLILPIPAAGFIDANERITPKSSSKNAIKWYIICHMFFLVSETQNTETTSYSVDRLVDTQTTW